MFSHIKHSLSLVPRRYISSAEISTALRPFYFVVHPDLFGRHPKQRLINEESLKHLSAHLEALQQRRSLASTPSRLTFYVRQTTNNESNADANDDEDDDVSPAAENFKQIHISIDRRQLDTKTILRTLLLSCDLSTAFVDTIKSTATTSSTSSSSSRQQRSRTAPSAYPSGDTFYGSAAYDDPDELLNRIRKVKRDKTLIPWLDANLELAHTRSTAMDGVRADVANLERAIVERLQLYAIRYDCGWNVEHYRGCLKSLNRLADQYVNDLRPLRGRTVMFAPCSGVNLEGEVMLFTGDVHRSWLKFIRNIAVQDDFLTRIPAYESSLSNVLLNIQIARRKFMPKAQVTSYADQLRRVTTSMLDYLATSAYPKRWPATLEEFELVVESESGPLMLSPTGQFITPSTCSGYILVDFLNGHMDEARERIADYKKNKHVERDLHDRCIAELRLQALTKDDSIDPQRMIECLERLLAAAGRIPLDNVHLNITNYYSVLADGTVCIPWDWSLDD